MNNNELDILRSKNVEEFNIDTKTIISQTNMLLKTLYPSYLIDTNNIHQYIENNSAELLDGFTFFRIISCSIDDEDDEFEYLNHKMQKLFSSIHTLGITIAYGVIAYQRKSNLVIGISNSENVEVTTNIILGLLSGVELEALVPNFMDKENNSKFYGVFPAIPSCKIDKEVQTFDIAPMMRSLNGQDYTLLVIAKPVFREKVSKKIGDLLTIRDKCFSVSKRNIGRQKNVTDTVSHSEGGNTSTSESTSKTYSNTSNGGISIILASAGNSTSMSKASSSTETTGVSWDDSISNAISSGETISGDIQNGFAMELMGYAENGIDRFKLGQSSGMWQTAITYSSNSKIARDIIQASLNGEISKPNSKLLPSIPFSIDNYSDEELLIPTLLLGDKDEDNPLCTYLTSAEVGLLCTLPVDVTPDFELKHYKQYPLISTKDTQKGVELGKLSDSGRVLNNMSFSLSESDLNKHTFVCGITGSGKTTTIKGILANCDKPFMVIESAKKEYRHIKPKNNKSPEIYTLGKPEINCLQMNPFYIMAGVSPQTHIDYLKDLFNASFSFYGPMPYILEKCLQNVYIKKGWDLTLGYHPYLTNKDNPVDFFDFYEMQKKYDVDSHKFLFPTMYELKCEIERYIEQEMQYDGEVAGNIKTAIKTRLESLCNGAKGYMFNTYQYADMEYLLNNDVIFELEGLADDSDKAFCVGMLVIFINEYRQVKKEIQGNQKFDLQHLLVIEEAHRLLKNINTDRNSESMGNPKGKAVEHFTNMIAEMRSYGQGVIIAEQIPSKLAPDVIKNSSNKIIQRVVSYDDQEIIANTIGIPKEESIFLGTLKTGFALCHKEGMTKPVNVKINPIEDIFVPDSSLYNKDFQERMYLINSSIINDVISTTIEKTAFKLLNTLLISDSSCCVSSITKVQEIYEDELCEKGVELVLFRDLNKILANELSATIMKYLMTGVFSVGKLISNDISKELFEMLRTPTENKVNIFKDTLNKLYSRNAKKVGLLVVSEMLKNQYNEDVDIRGSIQNFFIQYESNDIEEVIFQLKGGANNDN